MTSVPIGDNSAAIADGPRPVNLRTDLAPLADLIELVFAESMDQGGRAAVREMRYLSKVGVGLTFIPGLNDLTHGVNMGYVWMTEGRLVGNVSIYPTNKYPNNTWIIANVGVHPDYQRRGIATQLMHASMDAIRQRGGRQVILQVDVTNETAQRVYERLGFVKERSWILWRRSRSARIPPPLSEQDVHIVHRRRGEWQAEFELGQRVRPAAQGGIGWQRPLTLQQFRRPLVRQIGAWLNMRTQERLVIRSADELQLHAAMWIENAVLNSTTQLTLMVAPEYRGIYDVALINTATRRYAGNYGVLLVEHPRDETVTGDVLRDYHFRPQREVMHMRWDVQ